MPKKNKLIPFRFFPASWGLVGQAYDEAEAFYSLNGEDLERKLVDIRTSDSTQNKLAHLELDKKYAKIDAYDYDYEKTRLTSGGEVTPIAKLDLDLAHGRIKPYEHACAVARIKYPDPDSLELQIALLTLDYDYGHIELNEYEKTLATAKNERWVGVVGHTYDPDHGVDGFSFELDWNDQWIDFLRSHGYHGSTELQIVEQWFSDVSRTVAEDPFDPTDPIPFNSNRAFRSGGPHN